MSTCSGAPPPHDDCPHGDACDWDPRELPEDVRRSFERLNAVPPQQLAAMNRRQRRDVKYGRWRG